MRRMEIMAGFHSGLVVGAMAVRAPHMWPLALVFAAVVYGFAVRLEQLRGR